MGPTQLLRGSHLSPSALPPESSPAGTDDGVDQVTDKDGVAAMDGYELIASPGLTAC